MSLPAIRISGREIGPENFPLVIAEIGINHEGDINKAKKMIDDAVAVGCECVKFQSHVIDDEMIPNKVIPGNADESIWDIMNRCALSEKEEFELLDYCRQRDIIFLSTPFSRAAADRLERIGVEAFKIGSGECNNFPLVEHIAAFGKPIILSTGMNTMNSIKKSVSILEKYSIPYAILHCTSIYPTPYNKVRLGVLSELRSCFPSAVIGLSDHSLSNYPCLASVALGASIIERHFVSDKSWPGPDVEISMDPKDLKEMINGCRIIYQCIGGTKTILPEEQPTIDFAYASVVSIADIEAGEEFTKKNIWVKRPGNGEILAGEFKQILKRKANVDIPKNTQIQRKWIR